MRVVTLGQYRILFTDNYNHYSIERNVSKDKKNEVWAYIPFYSLTEFEQELLKELIEEWTSSWDSQDKKPTCIECGIVKGSNNRNAYICLDYDHNCQYKSAPQKIGNTYFELCQKGE